MILCYSSFIPPSLKFIDESFLAQEKQSSRADFLKLGLQVTRKRPGGLIFGIVEDLVSSWNPRNFLVLFLNHK